MAVGSVKSPADSALRVLVVDDSPAVQRLVAAVLNAEPNMRVVGIAGDGVEALQVFPECEPDVVVLDLEMPGMDGPSTFAALAAKCPELAVVVFSGVTPPTEGALGAAIASGQVTAVTKPSGVANLTEAFSKMRGTLIPAIKAIQIPAQTEPQVRVESQVRIESNRPQPTPETRSDPGSGPESGPTRRLPATRPMRVDALVIGASTGGPDALDRFFSTLQAPLPVPTFVVQHISAYFSKDLARRLDKHHGSALEAIDGEVPQPGYIYLAPGGRHLTVAKDDSGAVVMRIIDTPPVKSCRPSVDVLFGSTAEVYGAFQLGIIMTGMGQDGLNGCRKLAEQRATILAQDKESSVIWGMPGSVVKADLADQVAPVIEMAQLVNRWLLQPPSSLSSSRSSSKSCQSLE